MAIAFDSSVDGVNNGGSGTLTFAFNNVAGDIVCVGIAGDTGSGADDITGVTYNAVSMTLAQKNVASSINRNLYLYYLLGPATGSHNVAITISGSHYLLAGAISLSGAKQSAQPDANNTGLSAGPQTSLTTSVTTVADNCWTVLLEGAYDSNNPPGAGTGSTRRVFDAAFGTWGLFTGGPKTPAGSTSMQTTRPNAQQIGHVMASFSPAAAAAGGPSPFFIRRSRSLTGGMIGMGL